MSSTCPLVLAVAGDPLMCGLIEDVLMHQKLVVEITDDPQSAIHRLGAAPVDLILLDLGWPEARGMEVCAQLRAQPNGCYVPIIALTTTSAKFQAVTAFNVGPNEYLTKPFHIADLLAAVARYCPMN